MECEVVQHASRWGNRCRLGMHRAMRARDDRLQSEADEEPERKCTHMQDATGRIDKPSTREGAWTLLISEGGDVSGVERH